MLKDKLVNDSHVVTLYNGTPNQTDYHDSLWNLNPETAHICKTKVNKLIKQRNELVNMNSKSIAVSLDFYYSLELLLEISTLYYEYFEEYKENLVSKYTLKRYKHHKTTVNNSTVTNALDRNFNRDDSLDVIVSDLTYVQVGSKLNYICTIVDLHNREIIGYSIGKNKTSDLVIEAFNSINRPLDKVNIFHTDRGSEFNNKAIDELISTYGLRVP